MKNATSPWDIQYGEHPNALEQWLYADRSVNGKSRDWLVERARTWPTGTTMLDLGCGGGVVPYRLMQAGLLGHIEYRGLDGSQAMVDLARRKVPHASAEFRVMKIEQFEGVAHDRVLLSEVVSHQADPAPVLTTALQAVADGGKLLIVFWNNPADGEAVYDETSLGVPDVAHPRADLEAIMAGYGFVISEHCVLDEPTSRGEPTREIWVVTRVVV